MRLFVFQDQTTLQNRLEVNETDNWIEVKLGKSKINVDYKHMNEGDSMLVIFSPVSNELIPLYNFRELQQIYGLKARDFCDALHIVGVFQTDIVNGDCFCKAFLSEGQYKLDGNCKDTNHTYKTLDGMHALDISFSYTASAKWERDGGKLIVTMTLERNGGYKKPVYCNYGAQNVRLIDGVNYIKFDYIPGESLYTGTMRSMMPSREVKI